MDNGRVEQKREKLMKDLVEAGTEEQKQAIERGRRNGQRLRAELEESERGDNSCL